MTLLKSLTFAAQPKKDKSPALKRRTKMIARLEEQKLLLANPAHVRTVQKWVVKDGEKKLVDKQQRVMPWWQVDPTGACLLVLRSGSKPIEFEKGKAAVSVPAIDKLPSVIDTLIKAVAAGELDQQLGAAVGEVGRPIPGGRKAA
jgi:hypothetical protein